MESKHKYFSLAELLRSETAEKRGIPNVPSADVVAELHRLMDYLDSVRENYGAPIRVSSGYRSPALNAAVGGKPTSQHLKGQAADLVTDDLKKLGNVIRRFGGFDQLIYEHVGGARWIHVSIAPEGRPPRGEVLYITK
ncbi:D-Ala-D-Ala carboxypeptidase family metallohydrolase [Porphyromonas sp. oral taxon 275]|uniref:D-Ala-D-Ala carboxypeptidase family metallohydrolase n=1 Tax=Porphyromonas sp. oral taxon 275 TaxID=712435 RepID=UPI001BA8B796|nr:D-Ala-D-Ala carboxypeptidase family metallohydrolase [Porphyromonas sp. oral taxon 275]QUB42579.1 DUF882 domain-containing protein [Porphyromonas sp. oral taxon 275]